MIRSFLSHPSPVLSPAPWRIENPLLVGSNSLLLFVSPCRLLPAPVGTERLMIRERFKEPIGGATPVLEEQQNTEVSESSVFA
ncbi:unnamed protein product [Musa hybrid cultivar]